ncbi:MAG: Flp pilus assembly complex ATPase component TadA [Phycisphaerae bacterium]|nr:Flp pilus assembly complex ATPase component TadA [Phycisphaerae bacterium]
MATLLLRPTNWQGRTIRVEAEPVTIGRHPDNAVCLHDEKLSRFHCVIEPMGGGFQVRDLQSRNGTRLNEQKIDASPITPGDTLRVGDHEFIAEFLESAPAPRKGKAGTGARGAAAVPATEGTWAAEFERLLSALPPKDAREEPIQLIDAGGTPSEALTGAGDGPTAMLLLLQIASKAHATDIHLEPKGETTNARMRVDGQMVTLGEMPRRVGDLISGLVKTACQMTQAARDAVQEGHFSAKFPDRRVEFRISFTPSVHGQKLVLRVLDERDIPRSLDELGLAGYMFDRLRRTCQQDHGLLLVCGPTGSGKTTTLYNALRQIDRYSRNVVTIEDPVEYQLDNVTQIPVNTAGTKENTFGSLLRSVLRQDPDVILVGEIRDEETARTAMQAAMTGHLVFSTVHSKDTISAVFRLLDLKVEPYLVANSLDLVLAQRLVRVLCDSCKRAIPVLPGVATRLGKFLGGKTQMMAATGCGRCLRTGYRGRRAIFELLDFTDDLRDVILRDPSIQAMKKVIEQGHFTTLAQSGWKLVADGVTTLDEVDHVAGQG